MTSQKSEYVPALRFHRLMSLYDVGLRYTLRVDTFKRRLVRQAAIRDGHRVLDLRCGIGTLTLLAKQLHPGVELVGLDAGLQVLGIARSALDRAGLMITLDEGMSISLYAAPKLAITGAGRVQQGHWRGR